MIESINSLTIIIHPTVQGGQSLLQLILSYPNYEYQAYKDMTQYYLEGGI
jgi:hypothetical protein